MVYSVPSFFHQVHLGLGLVGGRSCLPALHCLGVAELVRVRHHGAPPQHPLHPFLLVTVFCFDALSGAVVVVMI